MKILSLLHIPSGSGLILKSFGNETLLFHSASGDTLLLSPVAASCLVYLKQGPLDKKVLFESVAAELNYEVDEDFLSHMDEVLSGLMKRDIVAEQ